MHLFMNKENYLEQRNAENERESLMTNLRLPSE